MKELFSGYGFGFLVCVLTIVVVAGFRSQSASVRDSYQNKVFWRAMLLMLVIGYILIRFVLPIIF